MGKRRLRRAVSPPSSTLFAAPAPSQSRSRLYSHGYSQPLVHIRGRSQSRSKSPWTDNSGDEDDGSLPSQASSYSGVADKVREPSHRRLHLQKIHDLLHLSISRRDGIRAFRCLRILLKSHEWRPIELWRYALEVATLTSMRTEEQHLLDGDTSKSLAPPDRERMARKRLAFMRELSKSRTGLQLDVFIEIIPELLVLGEEQQAFAEIEIVINQYPYRLEPILHLYSALLFLKLSSPSMEVQVEESDFVLKGVSEADKAIAVVPHNLLALRERGDQSAKFILKEAERKFETVLNVGRQQRKRGRSEVSRSRNGSQSRSRSRSRSRSKSQRRDRPRSRARVKSEEWQNHASHDEGGEDGEDGTGVQSITEDEGEELQIEVGNDEWARNLARAYLAVLRAPRQTQAQLSDSDEEMQHG